MRKKQIDDRFEPVKYSSVFNRILDFYDLRNKKVLDLGCGYGEYLVHFGKGSVGVTTTVEEVNYANEKKIPILKGNVEQIDEIKFEDKFDVIWANNLFEHLLSPHAFLVKLKKVSNKNTTLILGVPVMPWIYYLMNVKKFRGSLATPHVNFFTKRTLEETVRRSGWNIQEVRPFIFKNKSLDKFVAFMAPHIYVVAKNDTAFNYPVKKINEWKDDEYYSEMLEIIKKDM